MLKNHANLLPFLPKFSWAELNFLILKGHLATDGNGPCCWDLQEVDDTDQGRFPCSRITDNPVNIPSVDADGHILNSLNHLFFLVKGDVDMV